MACTCLHASSSQPNNYKAASFALTTETIYQSATSYYTLYNPPAAYQRLELSQTVPNLSHLFVMTFDLSKSVLAQAQSMATQKLVVTAEAIHYGLIDAHAHQRASYQSQCLLTQIHAR